MNLAPPASLVALVAADELELPGCICGHDSEDHCASAGCLFAIDCDDGDAVCACGEYRPVHA